MRLVVQRVIGVVNRETEHRETERRVQLTGPAKFHRLKQIRIGLERCQPKRYEDHCESLLP